VKPQLQYLIFDDETAESIQKIALVAKQNINEYLTIPGDIAESTVQLMKFYVDTKKLLYGFPLITIPPIDRFNVGPSVSQQICTNEEERQHHDLPDVQNHNNGSNASSYSEITRISSSFTAFNGSTFDAAIEKILLYKYRKISSSRLAQILRVRDHTL